MVEGLGSSMNQSQSGVSKLINITRSSMGQALSIVLQASVQTNTTTCIIIRFFKTSFSNHCFQTERNQFLITACEIGGTRMEMKRGYMLQLTCSD